MKYRYWKNIHFRWYGFITILPTPFHKKSYNSVSFDIGLQDISIKDRKM